MVRKRRLPLPLALVLGCLLGAYAAGPFSLDAFGPGGVLGEPNATNATKTEGGSQLDGGDGDEDDVSANATDTAALALDLPKLEATSRRVNRVAAKALIEADEAAGLNSHKEALADYQGSLKARMKARTLKVSASHEMKKAKRTMARAMKLAKEANQAMQTKDATVVRQRQASLDDLDKALEVEQENRDNNAKMEELKQKLATAKNHNSVAEEEVKEMKAKANAEVTKVNNENKNAVSKTKAANEKVKDVEAKLFIKSHKFEELKKKYNLLEATTKNDPKLLEEKHKKRLAAEKEELLAAKEAKKQQKARVKAGKEAVKESANDVKKVQAKADAAVKDAAAEKDATIKGIVKASVAASALKSVGKMKNVEIAEKAELNTMKTELVRRKIEVRFLKLKHENAAQARAEAVQRAKKRGNKQAEHKEKREKSLNKDEAEMKAVEEKVKAKKEIKKENAQAKEKEQEEMAKAKDENKLVKKAEKQLEKAGADAAKQAEAAKKQADEDQKERDQIEEKLKKAKYLRKAHETISNKFDAEYPSGEADGKIYGKGT